MVVTLLTYSYLIITAGLLAYFLKKSLADQKTVKSYGLLWGLFGFIFNLYSFSWLYVVYPLMWLQAGPIQIVGIILIHLIVTIVSAIPFVVVGLGFSIKTTKHLKPFIFATSLVIAEIFRSLLLSVLFYGEKTTIDLHYITGTIGLALSLTPFIEFAYLGGTFALTFIIGYLVYIFISKKNLKGYYLHGVGILVLLTLIHFLIPVSTPDKPLNVGIISTNFGDLTDENRGDYFKQNNVRLHEMTLSLASSRPDIIVYPEDTRYLGFLSRENRQSLSIIFPNSLLIDGETATISGKLSNVSIFYTTKNEKVLGRGKSFLSPFNEYLPLGFRYIFGYFLPKEGIDAYEKLHSYTPIDSNKTMLFEKSRIGSLICSEILSYKTIQDLKKEKPSIVFFQSRLNVFHDHPWFMMHIYMLSSVAAAQLRTTVITSANNAPSLVISPYGHFLKTIPTGFSTSTFILK